MGVPAPVISAEMSDWVNLGGGNLGIVGDPNHTYGFHLAANEVGANDYSRKNDPNGPYGPYTNWNYCCAGDFAHNNNESLRTKHREVLARLMRGEMPMICEFIGKPWADRPVYYWARWNGIGHLEAYTGSGHDRWSHISWYRSRADQRPNLWTSGGSTPPSGGPVLRRAWPSYMPRTQYFGLITGPNESHGGYYANERPDVMAIQNRLIALGMVPGITNVGNDWADGLFEYETVQAVARWQRAYYSHLTTLYGQVWDDDWSRLFTY